MDMIAVVMAAPDTKTRFREAAELLNYGFSKSKLYQHSGENVVLPELPLNNGVEYSVKLTMKEPFSYLFLNGEDTAFVEYNVVTDAVCEAPVQCGQSLGSLIYSYQGKEIGRVDLVAVKDYEKAGFYDTIKQIIKLFFIREERRMGA